MGQKRDTGKTDLQVALSTYGRTVLCTVMSLFVYFSVTAVFSGLTPVIGERVYPLTEEGEYVKDENGKILYEEIYFEDEKAEGGTTSSTTTTTTAATEAGETTTTTAEQKEYREKLRGDLSDGARWGMGILIQLLTGTMLVVLVYATVWTVGDKDANMVAFGHKAEDKWRGFKIGCLATVPAAVLYVAYVIICLVLPDQADAYTAIYSWFNTPYMPLMNAVNAIPSRLWETVLMIFPLFVVPAVSAAAYALGYRQISVSEKLLYKNGKKKKKKHY